MRSDQRERVRKEIPEHQKQDEIIYQIPLQPEIPLAHDFLERKKEEKNTSTVIVIDMCDY